MVLPVTGSGGGTIARGGEGAWRSTANVAALTGSVDRVDAGLRWTVLGHRHRVSRGPG